MSTDQSHYFDTPTLKFLIGAGKVGTLVASGTTGGFVLLMRDGGVETVLRAQRGGPRLFSRLDTLARFLRELGCGSVAVELADWDDA